MDIFDPTRKRGTLRPSKPKRKQKLKKQPKLVPDGKRRLRRSTAETPLTLRQRTPETMPPTARWRRFRRDFGGVIRSVMNVQTFISSARFYSFILLVGCLYALYLVGTNQRFYLTNVSIEGVSALGATDILEASGLRGAHIFAIEPAEAAEAIGSLPGVISAEVSVNWPNDVQIVVAEDTPVLLWNEGGRDYWVTESGTLVPALNNTVELLKIKAVLSPVIQQPDLTELPEIDAAPQPVTYLDFVPQEVIAGAVALQELYPYITEMEFAPSGGLRFNDSRGWLAKYGTGEDILQKHTIYEGIADYVQREGMAVEYINVSVVENPVYKPISVVSEQ
jgi:hypothetical protein